MLRRHPDENPQLSTITTVATHPKASHGSRFPLATILAFRFINLVAMHQLQHAYRSLVFFPHMRLSKLLCCRPPFRANLTMHDATCDMQAAGSSSLPVPPTTTIFEQSGLALVGVKIVEQSTIFGFWRRTDLLTPLAGPCILYLHFFSPLKP